MKIDIPRTWKRFISNEKKGIGRVCEFFEQWVTVFKLLAVRFIKPISAPNFMLYFFVIILGLGAVGPWILCVTKVCSAEFYKSLAMFSLALAAGSYGEIILNQNREIDDSKNKVPEELLFPYACLFLATAASAVMGLVLTETAYNHIGERAAITSLVLGLAFWWQVNAENPSYTKPDLNPEDSIAGGQQIDASDTSGFNV